MYLFLYISAFVIVVSSSLVGSYFLAQLAFDHFNQHNVRKIEELQAEVMLLDKKLDLLEND